MCHANLKAECSETRFGQTWLTSRAKTTFKLHHGVVDGWKASRGMRAGFVDSGLEYRIWGVDDPSIHKLRQH